MTRIGTSRIIWIGAILVVVMIISLAFWQGGPFRILTGLSGRVLAPLSHSAQGIGSFFGVFVSRGDLATENIQLRRQLQESQADTTKIDQLQQENAFLRSSLDIRAHLPQNLIEGAVFSYIHEGGVRQMIANRGSVDGVSIGDTVITGQGALVGVVQEVSGHDAVVRSVDDPGFESAARIIGGDVTGLVHSDSAQGLILDLVQKSENVTESQVVATSGNDQFPAGIMIGRVKSVDNDSATLFKIVRVTPAIDESFDGQVFITRP